jgi:hypothetical protein
MTLTPMLRCMKCGQRALLLLNVCAECDPELHTAWQAACDSVIGVDDDRITPEMVTAYALIAQRKRETQP